MFVSLARLCVVYVVKEVASFSGGGGGLGQLMGVARKRTRVVSSSKICVLRLQSGLHLLLQAPAFEYTERERH